MSTFDEDDPFRPLSAKGTRKQFSISGREITAPGRARAARDYQLAAALRNKAKFAKRKGRAK